MKADLEKKTKKLSDREVTIQQLNTICKKLTNTYNATAWNAAMQ